MDQQRVLWRQRWEAFEEQQRRPLSLSETWHMYYVKFPREHLVFKYPTEPNRDPPMIHNCRHENECQRHLQADFVNGRFGGHRLDYDKILNACQDYPCVVMCQTNLKSDVYSDFLDYNVKKKLEKYSYGQI